MSTNSPLPSFEDHSKQETKYTTCYMCACRCGIKVTLENNKIRFIQGNKRHPVNKGVLCAKGNAGIMKQESPAKLKNPLMRKPNSVRGAGEFEEISWDEALSILTERLKKIRQTDPKKLAFFTGRDQMQGFTGMWAQQFGTINWAAHGGFCSVNMAAAGLYSMGHSFWEFGDPDWDRTKYFLLWGVAEDHSSNPIKIGLEKLKRGGGKFVAINPVRTGYQAIADEWLPVKPGTDAMLALSMIHVLLKHELFDWEFLLRYTNAPNLVIIDPGQANDGLFLRDDQDNIQVYDQNTKQFQSAMAPGVEPVLFGDYKTPQGQTVKTSFTLFAERYLDEEYAPANASKICGIDEKTITRIALEMAHVAFKETITVECEWTDWTGRKHDRFIGRPVSMHAMRGISAHSNGFQTCRALHLLQMILGTLDCPGGHRAKAPYPKHTPPPLKPAKNSVPDTPLGAPPLGFPTCPEDLVVDDDGNPLRIDKSFSWEAPLGNHGMLHMVITNAVNKDPYAIDTLLLFMANMAWNSSMNTSEVRDMLSRQDENGEYAIPFLVVVDAFHSEMTEYADLVLPDTTFLERYDTISILDRPISEPDAICDAIRMPVVEPLRNVRPWQEVMVDLAYRLRFPAFTNEDGSAKYKDYKDFIVRFEKAPGIGFLAGWRGKDGSQHMRGEPNPEQWERYIENECFFHHPLPENQRFYRFANRDYLRFAKEAGFNASDDPIIMSLYLEDLQRFRLAAQGVSDGPQPNNDQDRARISTFFDPLPFYYQPLEQARIKPGEYPFFALTQRPMMMYHSWDSQNAWLRQIIAQNHLFMNRKRAEKLGIADLSWVWVESHHSRIRAQIKLMEGVQEDTVWTWNAIGKRSGAWGLEKDANEATHGFLINHLISELLPQQDGERPITNSDPITGQAAWFDLKVKIYPAEKKGAWPVFAPSKFKAPAKQKTLRYQTHSAVHLTRDMNDILSRGEK
ncbi:MAG: molybdopterin oxidoreductase family protein [Candidatus Oxydemutatoraceae bacterium WSBS_2016_MAG_OTU14]